MIESEGGPRCNVNISRLVATTATVDYGQRNRNVRVTILSRPPPHRILTMERAQKPPAGRLKAGPTHPWTRRFRHPAWRRSPRDCGAASLQARIRDSFARRPGAAASFRWCHSLPVAPAHLFCEKNEWRRRHVPAAHAFDRRIGRFCEHAVSAMAADRQQV